MDDPDEMFQLADLLEGVSVDCSELSSETHVPGINHWLLTHKILPKHPTSVTRSAYLLPLCCFGSTENKVPPTDCAEDLGTLCNEDLLTQVGHWSSSASSFFAPFGWT